MKALGLKGLPILAACALLFSITRSEASIVDVSGTYGGFGSTGTFSGQLTVTGGLYTGGDVTTMPTAGTNFGEFKFAINIPLLASFIDLANLSIHPTAILALSLPTPVNLPGAITGGIFSGDGDTSVPGDTELANLTSGTATPTPLPATIPLFATGVGGLGLLGWRRKRKAQAV